MTVVPVLITETRAMGSTELAMSDVPFLGRLLRTSGGWW
jgi:hypothetical protein